MVADTPSAAGQADVEHTSPRPDTTDPHRSRQRALKVLFAADVRREDPRITLDRVLADHTALDLLDEDDLDELDLGDELRAEAERVLRRRGGSRVLDGYARRLVMGVGEHRHDLDDRIGRQSHGWRIDRMALVDRNVLRLAAYELLHEDLRPSVVINEAVELVKELSGPDSPRFVNGVLEALRRRCIEEADATPREAGDADG